jgi:NAD(P)-dependent dehydrogenase (short-subunit alcohol dehydrogenase family)
MMDIRDEERVAGAVHETADKFGGIDILINKASYSAGTASAPATTSTTLLPIPRTGIRADRRPPRVLLGDGRWHRSRAER